MKIMKSSEMAMAAKKAAKAMAASAKMA